MSAPCCLAGSLPGVPAARPATPAAAALPVARLRLHAADDWRRCTVFQVNAEYGARSFLNGKASPGEKVMVTFEGWGQAHGEFPGVADGNGDWEVQFNGGGVRCGTENCGNVTVTGETAGEVHFAKNVVAGDVIFCSGQSNSAPHTCCRQLAAGASLAGTPARSLPACCLPAQCYIRPSSRTTLPPRCDAAAASPFLCLPVKCPCMREQRAGATSCQLLPLRTGLQGYAL